MSNAMRLPRGDEYLTAVQNPSTAFADPDLKGCRPELDQFGIPKPYSGGFTTTFHLQNGSGDWAVRCFTKAIADLPIRYEAIGRFLRKNPNDFLVGADYLANGIRVGASWQPIIKMEWLQGETLNSFIDRNIGNPHRIAGLVSEFVRLVTWLEQRGVAHGDLQHGNIIVKNGNLHLIDYDGFFLPELANLKTNEIGHVNYQHPARNAAHYNSNIDRFSSIVIYLGLLATSLLPSLWPRYNHDENVLFCASDFADPEGSSLLRDLESIQQLAPLVVRFRGVCKLEFNDVPRLAQFISGEFSWPSVTVAPSARPAPRSQYVVLDASKAGSLKEHIGERVEVIGLITQARRGYTKFGQPYVFLNFGFYPQQTFMLALWSQALNAFQQAGIAPSSLEQRWVKVTGVIGVYHGRPQMEIQQPSQVQVLAGEDEARRLLGVRAARPTPSRTTKPAPTPDATVFNTLYADKHPSPPSVRQAPSSPGTTGGPRVPAHPPAQYGSCQVMIGALLFGIASVAIWGSWGLGVDVLLLLGFHIGKHI